MNEQPELRIGDAEREAAVSALGEHYASGRLTKEEYDERSESAWTARTSAELRPLFRDLPRPGSHPAPAPAPVPAAPVRGGGWPLGVGVLPVLIGLFVLSVFLGHPVFLLVLVGALVFSSSRRRRAGRYRQHSGHYQR